MVISIQQTIPQTMMPKKIPTNQPPGQVICIHIGDEQEWWWRRWGWWWLSRSWSSACWWYLFYFDFFCSNSEVCIVPQDCLDWGPAGLWEVINRWKLLCDVTAAPGLWRLTPFLFLLVAVIVMIRILELFLLHLLSMADFNCNCSCCWNKRDFNFMVCQSFPNGRTDGRTSPDILRIPSWNVKGETWLYGLIKIQAVKFSQVSNTRNK